MIYGYFTYAVAGIVGFVIALCIGGFFVRKYYFARYSPPHAEKPRTNHTVQPMLALLTSLK
jgi:hypothetical protein